MDTAPTGLDATLQALGRRIKAERILRDWSREDLAARSKVTARQIGKIERGERGQMSEALRIAEALEISLGEALIQAQKRSS